MIKQKYQVLHTEMKNRCTVIMDMIWAIVLRKFRGSWGRWVCEIYMRQAFKLALKKPKNLVRESEWKKIPTTNILYLKMHAWVVIVDNKYRKIQRGNIVFVLVRFLKKYIFLILQFDVQTNSFDLGSKPITIPGWFFYSDNFYAFGKILYK